MKLASRRTVATLAVLAGWGLLFVFAKVLPEWLVIAAAVSLFALFVFLSPGLDRCLDPEQGSSCRTPPPERRDGPRRS